MYRPYYIAAALVAFAACSSKIDSTSSTTQSADSAIVAAPFTISDTVRFDSDDPAIWIDRNNPANSLILGTDKGGDNGDGAIYVFDLNGKEVPEKTVRNIKRPNNIDVAYGLQQNGSAIDIAVCTERNTNSIRVFSLPDMKAIDNGGIPVFEGDSLRLPMGIALYTASDGNIYAIVSRKSGPQHNYLWQYKLSYAEGAVNGTLVRKFGNYSGKHEIEAVAVDNELGYVYYSDEGFGIRKYFAHPDSSGTELAVFGVTGFADNHEGISIYKNSDNSGFILVSDQQANQFQVFSREGTAANPHEHVLIDVVKTATVESDGNEITSVPLPGFPRGLFVAMSDDKTFQFYQAQDLIKSLSTISLNEGK